jgi:troponin T
MSDDENEIEAEDTPRSKHAARIDDSEKQLSEAEKVMAEKKAKQEEDEAAKLKEYEEQRRIEREKEEEELRNLKEKQERRRQEREEEERQMAERRHEEEERRKQEEDERRKKIDAEKAKKDEHKKKRAEMMAGLQIAGGPLDVPKAKSDQTFDKFGNIVKAKAEMGLTKEQHEDQKRRILHDVVKDLDMSGLDIGAVKAKVKEMHQRICRLEGDKYDLEQRHQRQEYDLKELNERQRQISRNKALQKGLDPNEVTSSRHPPKVSVVNKYDRQTDRRSFKERRKLYEIPKAIPHFPHCPPPPCELEKVIKEGPKKEGEDEDEE